MFQFPPLPTPLEVWGETCGAEVFLQISCPWELCTQQPVKIQAFFIVPKAQEAVPASEIQVEFFSLPLRVRNDHLVSGSAAHIPPSLSPICPWCNGTLHSGLLGPAVAEQLAHLTVPEGALQCPRGSRPLPPLKLKVIGLLCPCGAPCAWCC